MKTPNTIVNWFFILAWVVVAMLSQMDMMSGWWIGPLVILWLVVKGIGSFFIGLNFYFFSHCSAITNERIVALTFDDGPDDKLTRPLLDLLDEKGAKATFFVIGEKVLDYTHLLKEIHRRGHLIGNHSFSHARFFDFFNFTRMRFELVRTRELIYKNTGVKAQLFRPPYGVTNPVLGRAIRALQLVSIGWSVRSLDTTRSPEKALQRLIKKTHPGAIILLHDTTPDIVEMTKKYLDWLKSNDYRVVSLDQLLTIKAYE